MGPPMTRRRRPGAAQGPIMISKKHSCYGIAALSGLKDSNLDEYMLVLTARVTITATPICSLALARRSQDPAIMRSLPGRGDIHET